MKNILLLLVLFSFSAKISHAQDRPKIILLMRHAEKASNGGSDPDLSEKGKAFATLLNTNFAELKIDAVYATDYKRTKQTVMPLAEKNALEIKVYDATKSADLVKRIGDSKDQVIVIAGHSNTVNLVFNELVKSTQLAALPDDEYGKVFIIYYDKGNPANSSFVKMRL
ncbi:SixA phosphatase family protein [Pedobacter duraquae]|uniref:Histidine phosphatase superfamily protein (Branch 1) n=1 Tax=Pedobacter duraquae TaxID=425511 RepID=A0A4R6IQ62_9SPHI|nr:histidine phosphatase family protein [Pedobacter duraquae]TDO24423.1 histidine phosphatase superfamily protein (branch 1) [Pedobacter duraquae]